MTPLFSRFTTKAHVVSVTANQDMSFRSMKWALGWAL
jgi:hypothetical protein